MPQSIALIHYRKRDALSLVAASLPAYLLQNPMLKPAPVKQRDKQGQAQRRNGAIH
jgi:hypothetical protein